jgi:hypothetical protein
MDDIALEITPCLNGNRRNLRLGALLADPSLAWMRTRAIAADLLGRRSSIQSAIAIVQLLDS